MTDQTRHLLISLVEQTTVTATHPQATQLLAALIAARAELLADTTGDHEGDET